MGVPNLTKFKRVLLLLSTLLIIRFLLPIPLNQTAVQLQPLPLLRAATSESGSCLKSTRRFIVVTTINSPTDSIKKLASMEGWCVIVVGDTKTPRNWTWPNCIYLSLETQLGLGYKTLDHVPLNHYGRKNIGYLYAIQQGAEVIYETDDDNLLIGSEIPLVPPSDLYLSLFPDSDSTTGFTGKREVCANVVNIYEYFGQPTTWPRGIPLECLATELSPPQGIPHSYTTNVTKNGLLERKFQIGVVQGLANGDPDLDAIFRMTRIPANEKIQIEFNPSAPLVGIAKGIYSPYNSQNTIYYRDAFWGLLLPTTTSSRVCDIWHGYITQRLMWDVGLRLTFQTATVVQYRNPHNYQKDFELETALYNEGGRLVSLLHHWDSVPAQDDIFSRMIALQKELVKNKFLGDKDVGLLRAWVDDLKSIGYKPPNLIQHSTPSLQGDLPQTGRKTLAWILHFSHKPIQKVVDILLKTYAQHFALIVIVTPTGRPGNFPHLESHGTDVFWSSACRNDRRAKPGGGMVRCYVRGLRILSAQPAYQGIDYIVLSNDDVILNMTKIRELAKARKSFSQALLKKGWVHPPLFSLPVPGVKYLRGWDNRRQWPHCYKLFSRIPDSCKRRYRERWGELAMTGAADVFFLLPDSVQEFIQLGDVVGGCWLEISLVNILGMLSNPVRFSDFQEGLFFYSWYVAGKSWEKDLVGFFSDKSVVAIHPFKLRKPVNRARLVDFTKHYRINESFVY